MEEYLISFNLPLARGLVISSLQASLSAWVRGLDKQAV